MGKALSGSAITNRREPRSCLGQVSTLSQEVLLITPKLHSLQMATSKVENSAQVLSCKLKFVHGSVELTGRNLICISQSHWILYGKFALYYNEFINLADLA